MFYGLDYTAQVVYMAVVQVGWLPLGQCTTVQAMMGIVDCTQCDTVPSVILYPVTNGLMYYDVIM